MLECQSCGGRYEPETADGQAYYHRCPPLSAVELAAAVKARRVSLPLGETVDDAVRRRTYERATLRDENVKGGKGDDRNAVRREGKGVRELAPAETPAPIVVVPDASRDPLLP
jgi:hypothetical protein